MSDKSVYRAGPQGWVKFVEVEGAPAGQVMAPLMVVQSIEDPVQLAETTNNFINIAEAGTSQIKTVAGILERVIINTPVASGAIAIYDSDTTEENPIGTITFGLSINLDVASILYGLNFSNGLRVVVTGTMDITIVYR